MLSRGALVTSGTVLVVALAAILVAARPGGAAFPGGNGRIVYTCSPDGQELCVINPDGSALGYLTQYDRQGDNFDERYPAWSPDGRRVAFVIVGNCTNEIYVMNGDRTGLRRVLRERNGKDGLWTIQDLSWAPDGRTLVLAKSLEGSCPYGVVTPALKQIFTIGVDGTGERRITNGDKLGFDVDPAWSPDGSQIAYIRELNPRDSGLWVMSPDGASRRRLDPSGYGHPDWSPDGKSIAYECSGGICVYTEGVGSRKLGVGSTPAWSPDGRQMVFALPPDQGSTRGIYVMATDGTGRREIAREVINSHWVGHPDWQPCRGPCAPAPGMPTFLKRSTPPQTLYASVGRGFTISLRNKARRPVKKLVEGTYIVRMSDLSKHHSFHVVGERGKFQPRSTVAGVFRGAAQTWQLKPGRYRFFCDAHPKRMHGSFLVVPDPRGSYRP